MFFLLNIFIVMNTTHSSYLKDEPPFYHDDDFVDMNIRDEYKYLPDPSGNETRFYPINEYFTAAESVNNNNNNNNTESEMTDGNIQTTNQNHPPRRMNRRRWKICLCTSICCIIVPLIIILPILFLVERKVDYVIQPLKIDDQIINIDPNGFTIPVNPVIHTTNENFFDIGLYINVQGKHPAYANGEHALGEGTITDATLYARSEQDIIFPFLVQYNRTYDADFGYFSELLTNCSSPDNMELYLSVFLKIDYDTWIQSGSMDGVKEIYLPCPITSEEAVQIQNLLGSGMLDSVVDNSVTAAPDSDSEYPPLPVYDDPLWAVPGRNPTEVPDIWG